jgi:putative long chain acyl-CoA synthase
MPRGVWRRVVERFAPASVLEFWAASEGEAILANVRGAKRGSQGRPLPGSAEVRIVRYDVPGARIEEDDDGFAFECEDGEIGLLLARIGPGTPSSVTPLRSVLTRGDAWLSTGSLFRRDRDGDHWLVDSVDAVVRNGGSWIPTLPITAALEELGKVDLAITYAAPAPKNRGDVAVSAVSLRDGATLRPADLARALGELDQHDWPDVVHVADELPMTAWYRPLPAPLRKAGIPVSSDASPAWFLDRAKDAYKPLSKTALERRVGRSG